MENKIKEFFRHPLLYIIIAAFFIRLYFLISHGIAWWDSSVYVGVGKYIFSGGAVGVNELYRPILWPLILGFVWKIGINPLVFGMIFDLVLNLISIWLVYIIAKKISNRKVAFFAALLMALSSSFIFYSSKGLTENLSVFLILLSVYFIYERKYALAGIFGGISVLARYPNALLLPAAIIFLFLHERYSRKDAARGSAKYALWFLIPVAALLAGNFLAFGNPLHQLIEAQAVVAKAGTFLPSPWYYYFAAITAECFFSVLFFYSVYISLKEKKRSMHLMHIIFAIFFIYYSIVARKEIRYLFVALPMLYLSLGHAIDDLWYRRLFGRHVVKYVVVALIILFALSSFFALKSFQKDFYRPESPEIMANFYNSALLQGKAIISSSPVQSAYIDSSVILMETSIFYKYINMSSDYYAIYTCDFFCANPDCRSSEETFLSILDKTKTQVYEKKAENGCEYLVYKNS